MLGLPRAAEVKTIRRKLNEIAERGPAAQWHRRLARRRAEQQPSALATLQQFPVASEVFCFSVKNAAITAGVS